MHAGMGYMERNQDRRKDIQKILPEAKSIISVALNYYREPTTVPKEYKVARYALGKDYHNVMAKKLKQLWREIKKFAPEAEGRWYVDTGPVLERAIAEQAGIGWIGKNTMLISKKIGSWFFLGEILSTLDLKPDAPATYHCGSCTACIDACPTNALEPGVLDARRCISYWTIEHRGDFPEEIKPKLGNHLFGCDICQEVCPWNRKRVDSKEERFTPLPFPSLNDLVDFTEGDYQDRFQGRPLKRATREGLIRNAKVIARSARRARRGNLLILLAILVISQLIESLDFLSIG